MGISQRLRNKMKALTVTTLWECDFCSQNFSNANACLSHERHCDKNPEIINIMKNTKELVGSLKPCPFCCNKARFIIPDLVLVSRIQAYETYDREIRTWKISCSMCEAFLYADVISAESIHLLIKRWNTRY